MRHYSYTGHELSMYSRNIERMTEPLPVTPDQTDYCVYMALPMEDAAAFLTSGVIDCAYFDRNLATFGRTPDQPF